ncbi:Fur-regulated basic protein FbpA [Radiobacillus deserti]|uniref:Fur-regulated basic protein FbpA n=1 Tax=Radiobacillus deserti TaxID=2594883 RepID=A0A516KKD9_9BACI|nr:Fur-regulated basic protein FbpA [Radiobacillus deserti]QDP41852.1 Fur-regulated basic protein FbpA [Radiobacillus deserti]
MPFLRKAVEQQKQFLIDKMKSGGFYEASDSSVHHKTSSELLAEYKIFRKREAGKKV